MTEDKPRKMQFEKCNSSWWNVTSKFSDDQLKEYLTFSTNEEVTKEIKKCTTLRFWRRWWGINE